MRSEPSIAYLRECFICDPGIGSLVWRNRPSSHFESEKSQKVFNTRFSGQEAGSIDSFGYRRIAITIDGVRGFMLAHRVLWAMCTGSWPKIEIDHINTRRSDNRYENLREATRCQNVRNRRAKPGTLTGLKGVNANRSKFEARIMLDGKHFHLGMYSTAEAAHAAYSSASVKFHGAFARSS